jgi:Arc/MetJ family transcription regulator
MASSPSAKARTELNVVIGYVDRAARRLVGEPGSQRQARTLERLSGELAEVLARLIAADQAREPAP